MSPDPTRHLALARELADSYREVSSVAAVAVGDSVGKGLADETSDLDLEVICYSAPEEIDRWKVVKRHADDPNDARVRSCEEESADEFFAEGILVDTRYWSLPRWTSLAKRPVVKSYWDDEALSHLDSMHAVWDPHDIVRVNKETVKHATARLRPKRISGASQRLREDVAELKELSAIETASREFFAATMTLMGSAFEMLAALNDTWIVFPKWARQWVEQLPMAPPHLCDQFEMTILEMLPGGRRAHVLATMREALDGIDRLAEERAEADTQQRAPADGEDAAAEP